MGHNLTIAQGIGPYKQDEFYVYIHYIWDMRFLLISLSIIFSFSLGITSYLWDQFAIAILFTIILPVLLLYLLLSGRYARKKENKQEKKKKASVDNYFHPAEKS